MLESHLVSERQFLYRHLVDVGMFPAHKMWPNEGVHMVGSESNHTRRAQKQSEGREPRFFALVSPLFFPRQFFTRALNALNRLNKMWKQQQQQNISINAGWKFRQKFYHNCSSVLTPSKIQPASKLFIWGYREKLYCVFSRGSLCCRLLPLLEGESLPAGYSKYNLLHQPVCVFSSSHSQRTIDHTPLLSQDHRV